MKNFNAFGYCIFGDYLLCFGGFQSYHNLNTVFTYNFITEKWTNLTQEFNIHIFFQFLFLFLSLLQCLKGSPDMKHALPTTALRPKRIKK